jgi:hypothetical protein
VVVEVDTVVDAVELVEEIVVDVKDTVVVVVALTVVDVVVLELMLVVVRVAVVEVVVATQSPADSQLPPCLELFKYTSMPSVRAAAAGSVVIVLAQSICDRA